MPLAFSASVIALVVFTSAGKADAESVAPPASPAPVAGQAAFVPVINPEVPLAMEFAGQKVDLDDVNLFERLDRELTAMTYTHGTTLLTIKRANRYFPMLAPILKANGVHPDFLYLACIESNLNPTARSGAGAAGIWQFMPATAKEYGLEVTDEVDERYDVEKETSAACRFIKRAFAKYGDWASVSAGYNGGTNRITTELGAQQADNALDLWLAEETMRYPLRMLAMKMIMEKPGDYGFRLREDQLYQPYEFTVEKVSGPVADWPQWARSRGIDYATLREFNPWIRSKKLTNKAGKTYEVKIPKPESLKRSKQKSHTYNPDWVM